MVYGEYVQTPQVMLAEKLASTLPPEMDSVYFVNSGTEAIEGALKLAKRYTHKSKIIACRKAYHGSTHGALSACDQESFKRNFRPLLPGFSHMTYGDITELDLISEDTAAVLIETIQGEAGVRSASSAYFQKLREKCNQTRTLIISDEIQCGFGRTGTFWAFEQFSFVPDILVSAKGMGGGMPIGCFISSQPIMSVFKNDPILGHLTTFGGHPVSAAASLATIKAIQEENLLETVHDKSERFKSALTHPRIEDIRNSGLMMAVQFESFEVLKSIIDHALENGVITDWFLFCDNSMRIAPPLTITNDQIDEVCDLLIRAINAI